jgi:acetyl-CoA carboxylase biotin carboxyl carrier protein
LDLKQIKQVIDLMKRSDLTTFEVEEEGFKIKIKRGSDAVPMMSGRPMAMAYADSHENGSLSHRAAPAPVPAPAAASPAAEEVGVTYVKSPMVGTFYRASSPESKAFVDIGSKVGETTVVCILEAMKIMNEIQAEAKGTVTEILVENGQPVEYGQRLFKLKQD